MKKRILLTLFIMTTFLMLCGFRENESKVFDDGNLLEDEQEEYLQNLCIEAANKTELDIIVVTTVDLGNKSCMEYADDFYDNGMYGYEGEYGSGVLFLISEDPDDSQVYISTAGLGILYIDDYDVEDILDAGWDEFIDYNYFDCFTEMIEETVDIVNDFEQLENTDEIMDAWFNGEYVDYEEFIDDYDYYGRESNLISGILICLVISLVVSGIAILIMNGSYKNKMTVHGGTYFKDNSFVMRTNYDNFIRTDVVRTKIQTSSGGGGGGHRSGGSSHRSSGGRSHGGGGRRR